MGFFSGKAKAVSSNVNNKLITDKYSGSIDQGTASQNFLAQLLGITPRQVGSGANTIGLGANAIAQAGDAQGGYENYLQNAGFAPAMRQLSQGIVGQGAAAGILNSGSTAKELQTRGTELNNSYFNNYLQHLSNLTGQGLQAGQLVANTGQGSIDKKMSGLQKVGKVAGVVGKIAGIFSDRRLKENTRKVGEFADGLGIYCYNYVGSKQRLRGVMADEVERLRPWALGPVTNGFATVDYSRL